MNRKDPLERAFELLKADSTGLAFNSNLEDKLMLELQRRNRPTRWKKVALVGALLVGVILAGGGVTLAARYPTPFKTFIFMLKDGQGGDVWIIEKAKQP
jgi:hypothetical protein